MKQIGKRIVWLLVLLTAVVLLPGAGQTAYAAGPSLTATLTDGAVVKNSRLTFDVWARNGAGNKITSTVALNGERVAPTWEDSDKTSYTLLLTKAGENTVTVAASSDGGRRKTLTYHITYRPAADGEIIGHAVWSVEAFTVGCGYLIEPASVPIRAGETAAAELLRLLQENGLTGYYGGSAEQGFYLAYIADGTAAGDAYNGYQRSGAPAAPRTMELHPSVPGYLQSRLQSDMDFFDPDDYRKNWTGYLGEFVISNGSGWMYSVNNNFPNVGFSDRYLSDGDVVRVQFTLGYGADIGGMSALGGQIPGAANQPQSGYYAVADKDALTKTLARARASGRMAAENVKAAYEDAVLAAAELNAAQSKVDGAAEALAYALDHPAEASGGGSAGNSGGAANTGGAAEPGSAGDPGHAENSGGFGETASSSEASADETAVPALETADKTSSGTGGSKPDAEPVGKMRPVALIGVVFAALPVLAVGICFCGKKISSRSGKGRERDG